MKKILKWALLTVVVLGVAAFGAFLYFIPPFFITPPEEFVKATVRPVDVHHRLCPSANRGLGVLASVVRFGLTDC